MDDDGTWHLIEDQPNASSQLGAFPKCKPVPTFIRTLPTSFNTELKKGGKPVPNSGRHHPYSDQPYPRRSEAAPQTERVKLFPTASSSTPSRPSGPRTSHTVRSLSRTEFSTDLQRRWIIFITQIGALSSFWREFSPCHSFEELALRLLDKYANSTVTKYLGTLQNFGTILSDLQLSWQDVGTHRIADLLQCTHEGRKCEYGFGATALIKALRWIHKLLTIDSWQNLHSPVVNSFFKMADADRNEAVPLSLFLVMHWERRVLHSNCSSQDVIILGGLLLLLWSGLRFSDGQRVNLSSLSWSVTALRGTAFRTKTTRRGQPWAIQASGFLSYGDFSWVAKWLMTLDTLWSTLSVPGQSSDFILPMSQADSFVQPLIPMTYSQALKWMRYYCTLPWKSLDGVELSDPNAATLHSLKTTTLSWSNQLAQRGLVTDEQRHLQGHHRRGSMRLYSRDDTSGQLALQHTVIAQVCGGFRFVTPLHRGSQAPLHEPEVSLEKFRKDLPSFTWTFLPFGQTRKDPIVTGILSALENQRDIASSDSEDSSSSSSSSSSDSDNIPVNNTVMMDSQWKIAVSTKIQHVMLLCDDSTQPQFEEIHFRAACGVRLPRDTTRFLSSVSPELGQCRHSGCKIRWHMVMCKEA